MSLRVSQNSVRPSFRSGSQILSPLLLSLLCIVLHMVYPPYIIIYSMVLNTTSTFPQPSILLHSDNHQPKQSPTRTASNSNNRQLQPSTTAAINNYSHQQLQPTTAPAISSSHHQQLKQSATQQLNNSSIQAFKHSSIQAFKHSSIQAFKHSSIQAFKHSTTPTPPTINNSIIP
jgi:hypothetical protein